MRALATKTRAGLNWRLEFAPSDCWFGFYWTHKYGVDYGPARPGVAERIHVKQWRELHVWICVLPMVPLHLWRRTWEPSVVRDEDRIPIATTAAEVKA